MDDSPKKKGSVQPISAGSAVSGSWPATNNPYLKQEPERRSMAAPSEISNLLFARKFRFVVKTDGLPDFVVKSVRVQNSPFHEKRELSIELYEVYGCDEALQAQKWIDSLYNTDSVPKRRDVKIESYDGCGTLISVEEFRNIKLKSESYDYCYSNSDPCSRNFSFSYDTRFRDLKTGDSLSKIKAIKPVNPVADDNRGKERWSVQFGFCVNKNFKSTTEEIQLIDVPKKRPKLDVDEVRIDFLNTSTWIPGKAKWNDLEIVVDKETEIQISNLLAQSHESRMILYYYDKDGVRKQSWHLAPVWLKDRNDSTIQNGAVDLTLRFNQVEYQHG